jgi:hypothetical protein
VVWPSIVIVISSQSYWHSSSCPFLFRVMGPCDKLCKFPQLDVKASHHHCPNQTCGKKYHAVCTLEVHHPQAEELGLSLGSDLLCPSCAFIFSTSGALLSLTRWDAEENVSNPGRVAEELNMKAGGDMEENVLNPGGVSEELNMKACQDMGEKVSNPGGVAKELNTKAGRDLE